MASARVCSASAAASRPRGSASVRIRGAHHPCLASLRKGDDHRMRLRELRRHAAEHQRRAGERSGTGRACKQPIVVERQASAVGARASQFDRGRGRLCVSGVGDRQTLELLSRHERVGRGNPQIERLATGEALRREQFGVVIPVEMQDDGRLECRHTGPRSDRSAFRRRGSPRLGGARTSPSPHPGLARSRDSGADVRLRTAGFPRRGRGWQGSSRNRLPSRPRRGAEARQPTGREPRT